MHSLGIAVMVPPNFNVETGTFDEPQLLDTEGRPILNVEEMDIFELARLRGTTVGQLKELMNNHDALIKDQTKLSSVTGQKHTKREYEKLKVISIGDVVKSSGTKAIERQFVDTDLEGILKVEKKKTKNEFKFCFS